MCIHKVTTLLINIHVRSLNMRSAVRVELVLVLIPLILLSIFTCAAAVTGMLCKQAEREALLDFKLSFTADPDGTLSRWSPHNPDCCTQWDGVECDDDTGHVVSLFVGTKLESHRLRPSLLGLQHLTFLDLSSNNFTMKIPEFISSLANLEGLDLSYSGFYGKIPPHLGNLTRLQTLSLGGRLLDEPPSLLQFDNMQWLPHLSSLQQLELTEVNLSTATDWVFSFKRLPSISEFSCFSCSFPLTTQPFSSSCPHNHSTSLQSLDLSLSQISFPDFLCLINGTSNLTSLSLESMEQNPDDFFRPLFQSAARSMLFPTLESLDISGNQLSDFMLGQNSSAMPKLETLDISYNLMNTILTFSSLINLDASSDTLNGSMYSSCMKKLQSLKISHNIITTLPDLSKFTSLVSLDASFNGIHDNFHSIQNLPTSLEYMDFSSNSLNGVISNSHFSKFSNLKSLDFSYNHLLTFNFSRSWVPPFSLTDLRLRSCNVGPLFPNWVSTQKDLQNLDISNSSMLGVIPKTFRHGITNLAALNVSHNKLHGPVPYFLFSISNLDLSNNNFSSFSTSQHILPNNFSWEINLSNNQLSGPLPGWIFRLHGLETLNVENNKLTGDIPSSIASSWELTALHMNNNRFSGELPSSMKSCSGLVILELGNNNFSRSLPLWIGDSLHQLSVLNMRSNAFTGELPSNLCNLQMLQVLDLSGNRLSGSIPGCVDNFTFMKGNQDHYIPSLNNSYASIRWKGILAHESDVVLPQLFVIDLSNNRLTGKIPRGFTTLTYLESLDLSSNDLNGSIPDKIGQLKHLEVLKLSSNRLGGEIPQSLADLTFLNTLNLSSNNLSGEIPKSTQLQSLDPSSYAGNPDLCGEPLPTLCPWDKPSVRDHAEEEESHESFDFEAFYAALGAGFASGLFGILGLLHFHAPSRHGFFHMASEIRDWIFVWTMLCKCRIKRKLCFSKEKEASTL